MANTLQWTQLHLEYLRCIEVSQCDTYLPLCTGVCMHKEACRLTRISYHVWRIPKWCLKGIGWLFTGFLRCVKVSHNLDSLDVLYRSIRIDYNL